MALAQKACEKKRWMYSTHSPLPSSTGLISDLTDTQAVHPAAGNAGLTTLHLGVEEKCREDPDLWLACGW